MFTEAQSLFDECFRQTIVAPSSILVHLAFRIEGCEPRTLKEIGSICNTLDRQRLRRSVDEYPYLIRIPIKVEDKYVLQYSVPHWIRDFFFDPTDRSRYFYSTSLVIDKCQKAIKSLILDPNPDSYDDNGLVYFFVPTPTPSGEIPTDIANATCLLEGARNGSDRNELLSFLEYLSEIHWFDTYNRGQGQRYLTNGIVHWVCTTLVG